jgi:hypothetical protein
MPNIIYMEAVPIIIARMTVESKLSQSDEPETKILGPNGFSFYVPNGVAEELERGEEIVLVYIPDSRNSEAIEVLALINERKKKTLIGEDQGKWVMLYKMKVKPLS